MYGPQYCIIHTLSVLSYLLRLVLDMWRSYLCLTPILYVSEFVWKFSLLSTTNNNNNNNNNTLSGKYFLESGGILNFWINWDNISIVWLPLFWYLSFLINDTFWCFEFPPEIILCDIVELKLVVGFPLSLVQWLSS